MVEFSFWVFRLFMMTIKNNETKLTTEASTSVHLLLATALGKGVSVFYKRYLCIWS